MILLCVRIVVILPQQIFKFVTSPQAKNIQKAISASFKPQPEKETYTYDDALERYKLTLANAIVKQAKPSESLYLLEDHGFKRKRRAFGSNAPDYAEQKKQVDTEENEFLHNALEGFWCKTDREFPDVWYG